MPQRTAILGWGSLLWEGGAEFDRWHDEWRLDGPSLKLEFSRVSRSRLGALTLVIDPQHGSTTAVAWCMSKRNYPDDAVADLQRREGCAIRYIARLALPASADRLADDEARTDVAAWAKPRKLDVVIWTALRSNFDTEIGRPFSTGEAIGYLKRLSAPAKVRAEEYICRAPEFVRTPLRQAFETDVWFSKSKA
jgi:hypothetical protein